MNEGTRLTQALSEAALWEASFAARALARLGQWEAVRAFHNAQAGQAAGSDWQTAVWLWAAGEDFDRLPPAEQTVLREAARRLLPELAQTEWRETLAWGALYGALRRWEPLLPELELARYAREAQAFVFARATHGGRLAGCPGGDRVDPNLLLLVPFGLFGVEDLLMVATVRALEAEGVASGAPAAWLAWYHALKGTDPRRLAELRASLTGDSLWETVVRVVLGEAGQGGVAIRHLPTGYDHPYARYTPERIPRDPVAGCPVELRATVSGPVESLAVEWSLDGASQQPVTATYHAAHWQSEAFWSAGLGPFAPGSQVRYRWVAGDSATGWYSFAVQTEYRVARLAGLRADGERLVLRLADSTGSRTAALTLEPGEEGALWLRLHPAGGTAEPTEAPPGGADDRYRVGRFRVRVEPEPLRLIVADEEGTTLLASYPVDGFRWWEGPDGPVRLECSVTASEGERFYGTGERFDRLDRRGTTVVNSVYNQYKGQGDRTYIPVPFLISSRGYGLWAATDQVGEIDLADSLADRVRYTFQGDRLDLCLIPGPEPAAVLSRFTGLTGRPVLPPAWAFGHWMSSNNWDSQAEVERQVALTEAHDIPASVVVVEQWSDEATFYLFNDARYQPRPGSEPFAYSDFSFPEWGRWPDPKGMVERLHGKGMKVLFWQIPVWKWMNGQRHEQRDRDEAFLIERGYVVTNPDGSPYRIPEGWFNGSLLIDFTNPAAVDWWLEKRRYLLDEVGLDGFKTDGGEFVWEREACFADGSRGDVGRNRYANQYIGATYRFVQEMTGGDGITFSRAGYTGAQRFPLHWAGDEASTWEAFRASIIAGLNAGLSGIPFWGWDLGGFSGDIPTAELFCRGAAMACFCPVMQYHAESKAQYSQDRTPWNIAERTGRPEVIEAYRFLAHLRLNLLPYLYSEAIRSHRTGIPMMRPMMLMHPEDPAVATMADQYYLGESLLVAPVVEPGAQGRRVYLPPGEWYDFWSDKPASGPGWVWSEAPWDRIPVFVRAGAVIPLNLAESGCLGEGMRHADYAGTRNLHLIVYPARGTFATEWAPGPAQQVSVRGQFDESGLRLAIGGLTETATVQALLPDGAGGARRVTVPYDGRNAEIRLP